MAAPLSTPPSRGNWGRLRVAGGSKLSVPPPDFSRYDATTGFSRGTRLLPDQSRLNEPQQQQILHHRRHPGTPTPPRTSCNRLFYLRRYTLVPMFVNWFLHVFVLECATIFQETSVLSLCETDVFHIVKWIQYPQNSYIYIWKINLSVDCSLRLQHKDYRNAFAVLSWCSLFVQSTTSKKLTCSNLNHSNA